MTARACPDPERCPVPAPAAERIDGLSVAAIEAGQVMWRVYEVKFGYDSFNPGFGQSRFAPFDGPDAVPVSTMYLGSDSIVALLETVFHDVHHASADRVIYTATLGDRALAPISIPAPLHLVDLRDHALDRVGLPRDGLTATTAEHYPCTTDWAAAIHARRPGFHGMIWHSRQAELFDDAARSEAVVLFGDRAPSGAGSYPLAHNGVLNLLEGRGRTVLDELAEHLDALVDIAGDP